MAFNYLHTIQILPQRGEYFKYGYGNYALFCRHYRSQPTVVCSSSFTWMTCLIYDLGKLFLRLLLFKPYPLFHLYFVVRDLEGLTGTLVRLFHQRLGTYLMEEACFHRVYYYKIVTPLHLTDIPRLNPDARLAYLRIVTLTSETFPSSQIPNLICFTRQYCPVFLNDIHHTSNRSGESSEHFSVLQSQQHMDPALWMALYEFRHRVHDLVRLRVISILRNMHTASFSPHAPIVEEYVTKIIGALQTIPSDKDPYAFIEHFISAHPLF